MARKKRNVSGPSAAPPVAADFSREKPSRSRRAENTSRSASRCRLPRSTAAVPLRDRPVEQAPSERAGVHDPRANVGRGLLPHPRRQKDVGRADLAQIAHRRRPALREAHPDPAQERHRHDVDLLHDPGQRQDRDILVGGQPRVGAQVGRDVLEERPMLEHGELGLGGGARGRAQDRHVLAPAERDLGLEPPRLGRQQLGPFGHEPVPADQARVVVAAHAAIVAIDDQPDVGMVELEQLVDLLLVLAQHHADAGRLDQVAGLGRERVLVDPERQAAQRMRGQLAPDPVGPTAADQAHHLAAAEAEAGEPECHQPHLIAVLRPAAHVPDAEILLAHRHVARPVGGVVEQQLGQACPVRRATAAACGSSRPRLMQCCAAHAGHIVRTGPPASSSVRPCIAAASPPVSGRSPRLRLAAASCTSRPRPAGNSTARTGRAWPSPQNPWPGSGLPASNCTAA